MDLLYSLKFCSTCPESFEASRNEKVYSVLFFFLSFFFFSSLVTMRAGTHGGHAIRARLVSNTSMIKGHGRRSQTLIKRCGHDIAAMSVGVSVECSSLGKAWSWRRLGHNTYVLFQK